MLFIIVQSPKILLFACSQVEIFNYLVSAKLVHVLKKIITESSPRSGVLLVLVLQLSRLSSLSTPPLSLSLHGLAMLVYSAQPEEVCVWSVGSRLFDTAWSSVFFFGVALPTREKINCNSFLLKKHTRERKKQKTETLLRKTKYWEKTITLECVEAIGKKKTFKDFMALLINFAPGVLIIY